jgi:hypothetical protein
MNRFQRQPPSLLIVEDSDEDFEALNRLLERAVHFHLPGPKRSRMIPTRTIAIAR